MNVSIAKIAKSKFFIPGLVIVAVVIGWLVVVWTQINPSEEATSTTWSQKDDYVIKETSEGTFVENKKAGLSFKVPAGWRVEIDELPGGQILVGCLEKDAKLDSVRGFLIEGCAWQLGIKNSKAEAELLAQKIQDVIVYQAEQGEEISPTIDIINIDKHKAMETILSDNLKFGKTITIEIPLGEKVYYFETLFVPSEEECPQEFNKFLETVSIQ